MGIMKRAVLYVKGKKVRSVLLFVLFLAMGLFLLVGLSIRRSAVEEAEKVRKSLTTGVTIQVLPISGYDVFDITRNEKNEMVLTPKIPVLTRSKLSEIAKIEGIKGFYAGRGSLFLYTGLDVYPGFYSEIFREYEKRGEAYLEESGFSKEAIESNRPHAQTNNFYCVDDSRWCPFFTNGALELIEGRHIEMGDVGKAVISEDLAERNGLEIGDKIQAYNYDFLSGKIYGSPFESEIVGIYRINFVQDLSGYISEGDILENTIFADGEIDYWGKFEYNTHYRRDVSARQADPTVGNVTLFVEDPMMIEEVERRIKEVDTVDWDYYKFETYDRDYREAAAPLLLIVKLSTAIAVILAAGMLMILSLILNLWIRGRKQEMGILTSIGVRRRQMLCQLLLECLLLAVPALLAAALLAGPVTSKAGSALAGAVSPSGKGQPYKVEIETSTTAMEIVKVATEAVDLEYRLTPEVTGRVIFVILTVILLSVLIPFWRFTGDNPLELLRKK